MEALPLLCDMDVALYPLREPLDVGALSLL